MLTSPISGRGRGACARPRARDPRPGIGARACAQRGRGGKFSNTEKTKRLGQSEAVAPPQARGRARVGTSMPSPGAASGGAGGCGGSE